MNEFSGKVALVTGAGGIIGRAIAKAFTAQGAKLAVNDITPVNLKDTVEQIRTRQGQVIDCVVDVAKRIHVQTMIDQIMDEWGQIDILVNNAAVKPHASLLELDEWDWRRTLDVNLTGPFFCMQTVGRVMRQQGGGVIVNIGSIAGCNLGLEYQAAYIASKMGLIGLTKEAARELVAYNIRVNAICPGLIETEMTASLSHDPDVKCRWMEDIPMTRLGQPQEVANLVLFLCSNSAAYITWQAFNIDGGRVMC
jgi:3-oxoacyl-[acyl-carrier protein] reductase